MKPRTMVFRTLAAVAAAGFLATILLGWIGPAAGIGKALSGALLFTVLGAPLLYLFVIRTASRDAADRSALSWKAAEQELLGRVVTLALQEESVDGMLRKVAEEIGRIMSLPRCAIRLFGDPETVIEHREPVLFPADSTLPHLQTPDFWKESSPAGKGIVVSDARQHPVFSAAREKLDRLRMGAFIGVALCAPGEDPAGVLFLCRSGPHAWTESEIRAAEAVGSQVALVLRHVRVSRAHREKGESLSSLLNNVPAMVYRGLRDWSMVFVGAEVKRMTGYAPEEFTSGAVSWKNLIHPEDMPQVKLAFRNAVQCGRKVLRVEYRARHKDGMYKWFADRRQLFYDNELRFLYVDGLCLDITERKRTEEKERQRLREGSDAGTRNAESRTGARAGS